MAANPGRNGAGRQNPKQVKEMWARPGNHYGMNGENIIPSFIPYEPQKSGAGLGITGHQKPPKQGSAGNGDGWGGGSGGGGGYSSGGSGGGGGGSSTQTTTSLSSQEEAKAVLYAGLKQILGRIPTKQEVHAYYKALNIFEKANPTVSTSSGDSASSTGGVSAAMASQFTDDWVNKDADLKAKRGAHEMATTYMDAFLSSIGNPVSI